MEAIWLSLWKFIFYKKYSKLFQRSSNVHIFCVLRNDAEQFFALFLVRIGIHLKIIIPSCGLIFLTTNSRPHILSRGFMWKHAMLILDEKTSRRLWTQWKFLLRWNFLFLQTKIIRQLFLSGEHAWSLIFNCKSCS